jgi:hypothetical protein
VAALLVVEAGVSVSRGKAAPVCIVTCRPPAIESIIRPAEVFVLIWMLDVGWVETGFFSLILSTVELRVYFAITEEDSP